MDDWADEKESLVSSVSDEEKKKKKSQSNGDEQAGSSTSISTGEEKEKMDEGDGERQEENGETSAGSGIIDSIASKFGVTVPSHSPDEKEEEEGEHKEEDSGGIIYQIISSLPESLTTSGLCRLNRLV